MNLKEYKKEFGLNAFKSLADNCDTTFRYLSQIAKGDRFPSRKLAAKIARYSHKNITLTEAITGVSEKE